MQLEPEELARIRDIAHDLRGGTWVVKGFLELLHLHWDSYDSDKRRELISLAHDNVARIEKAAKDLDEWRAPAASGGSDSSGSDASVGSAEP
ncbi:MAG: hypothetical protein QOH90_348 [Actinomycetota bacterium]|nr:hypothetical protein [Actinomycetota bacterium]